MSMSLGFKVLGRLTSFNLRMIEIKSPKYSESITYSKINTEHLDVSVLKSFLQMTHTQDINVFQIGSYLGYQYRKNVPVFIGSDGLVYAQDSSYNSSREAIILLQKLNKFNLVLQFKRTQWHYRPTIREGWRSNAT